jgi:hypothetical protein
MARMRRLGVRSAAPRVPLQFLALTLLLLTSCSKPKIDYWGQPAGPEEQPTPGFPEVAARLYSALEQQRQKLTESHAAFDQFQPTVDQLKKETQGALRTRVDRDLDFLLKGYSGKLKMLRYDSQLRNDAEYLPAPRQQLDQCHAELSTLFTTHPMPRPSPGPPLSPCLASVPRAK